MADLHQNNNHTAPPDKQPPSLGAVLSSTAIAAAIAGAIAGAFTGSFNLPLGLSAIPFIIAYKVLGGPTQPFWVLLVAMLIGLIVVKLSLVAIQHAREQAATSPWAPHSFPCPATGALDTVVLTPVLSSSSL